MEFTVNSQLNAYIIETDANNNNHHGLHTNKSPFVLKFGSPKNGDKVKYVLRGEIHKIINTETNVWSGEGDAVLSQSTKNLDTDRAFDENIIVKVKSHTRSAMLGEDAWEDAPEWDLRELFLEHLNGADWEYAPVEVEVEKLHDGDEDETAKRFFAKTFEALSAKMSAFEWKSNGLVRYN